MSLGLQLLILRKKLEHERSYNSTIVRTTTRKAWASKACLTNVLSTLLFLSRFRFVVAARKIKAGEIILLEKPTLVGPPLEASTNELCPGCLGKLRAKSNFSCSNCQIRMCEEKCQNDSELHQLECGFLVNKCHKIEFLTALRFLGLKKRHPGKYQSLLKLVSNKNVKVISLTGFEFDDFQKGSF